MLDIETSQLDQAPFIWRREEEGEKFVDKDSQRD